MLLKNHANFNGYETRNKKEHVLGADPSYGPGDAARTWWNSADKRFKGWDGAAVVNLTNLIETLSGDGTVVPTQTDKNVALAIAAASQTVRGTMSAVDKTKLDAATPGNTADRLVQRDASGNFSAGTITAALQGLAADSTLHGGATLSSVREFNQSTGQRTARSAISDFDTIVRESRLDQMTAPQSIVSMNNQRLASLADPVNAQDGATKNYVDSIATGLDPKASVRLATSAALPSSTYANGSAGAGATLTGTANAALSVNGVAVTAGSRILVKNQVSGAQNGIYVVTQAGSGSLPFILTRATDADVAAEVTPGMFTFVEEGSGSPNLSATGWVLTTTGAITIGTTALTFAQFSGSGTYLAGSGLNLTGGTFSAVGTAGRITVGATIDIASTYVGQTSITTVGTIGTGVWNGTDVAVAAGGTGASDALTARVNLGAATMRAADLPAGTNINWNHGMGTEDVIVQVMEKATKQIVTIDPTVVDANNITIGFGDAVAANAYRVVGMGIATA